MADPNFSTLRVPQPTGTELNDIFGSPYQFNGYGDSSPTGSSSALPNPNQGTLDSYSQAINNTQAGINRLGSQLNSGNSAIDSSYQNALNQLLLSKNQGQASYDTATNQTKQNYVGAKNTIGAQAGSTLNGLLRLLGSRGAGGGSTALISAPQAVTRGATQQRTDIGNTFGQNLQSLDTNWNNFLTGYNNQVSSAGSQRDQQKQSLKSSINTNNESLLRQLAQLQADRATAAGGNPVTASQSYLDQANALADQNANYTTAPINYQTQAYTAPNLTSYTSTAQTPTYQGQPASNDFFSPYLAALLGKKQQIA